MENTGFLIGYKTKTGCKGSGTHAFKSRDFTLKRIEYLNKEYSDVHHYIMTAPTGTPFSEITDYSLKSLV